MRGIKTSACPSPQLDPEITATPEAMESDIVRGSLYAKTRHFAIINTYVSMDYDKSMG
jgi:hypothetical protein